MHISCSASLSNIFYIVKNIMNIIMIISPILVIISFSIVLIKMTFSPEDKKIIKRLSNILKALIIIFLIPTFLSIVMYALGESNDISKCYLNSSKFDSNSSYIDSMAKEKTSIMYNPRDYEKGNGKLDFSCKSNVVKSQFSCETLRIVEDHLYDVNAQNFYSYINSKGGFSKYAESLGGVFGEYYGKKVEGRREVDFQRAAEYVLGWMYMYGWDYMNGSGRHVKWGGSKYTKDAFYYYGGWERKYTGNFDDLISGKNGVGMMSSECGDLEHFVYWKMGMNNRKVISNPTTLRNLKIGDGVYFFDHRVDKSNPRTWGIGTHNVVVGEVYDDRIVFYDGGSRYEMSRNYKYTVYFPSVYSEEADYQAMKKTYGYEGWAARRFYNFEN